MTTHHDERNRELRAQPGDSPGDAECLLELTHTLAHLRANPGAKPGWVTYEDAVASLEWEITQARERMATG